MTPMDKAVYAAAREARAQMLVRRDVRGDDPGMRERWLRDARDEWDTLPDHVHAYWQDRVRPVLAAALESMGDTADHACVPFNPDPATCPGCKVYQQSDEVRGGAA